MEAGPSWGGPPEPEAAETDVVVAGSPGASLLRLCVLLWAALFVLAVLVRYALLLQQQQLPGTLPPGGATAAAAAAAVAAAASAAAAAKGTSKVQLFRARMSLLSFVLKEVFFNLIGKAHICMQWAVYCLLWRDTEGLEAFIHRERLNPKEALLLQQRTIVFVRHGESMWNLCFNRGVCTPQFPLRFLLLVVCELLLLWEADSVVLDSPLSSLGVDQALALRQILAAVAAPPGKAAAATAAAATGDAAAAAVREDEQGKEETAEVSRQSSAAAARGQAAAAPRQQLEAGGVAAAAAPLKAVTLPQEQQQQQVLFLTSNLRTLAPPLSLPYRSLRKADVLP
ncbi:hypothetical protein Esti_006213 [Eimeria stiedai]